MPYILTEQEKNEFRQRYLQNVAKLNKYLPDGLKVSTDLKALNKRLNDPKEQRLYKKAIEVREKEERRQDIYDQLANDNRYLRTKGKTYALDRVIQYQFSMKDDKNTAGFNQNVIRNYYLHPEAMVQQEYTKLLQFDPTEISKIAKSNDIENLLVEYYDKNPETCEYAYAITPTLRAFNKETLGDGLNENLESISSTYETLNTASELVKTVSENSFFVLPKLTKEQAQALEDSNLDIDSPEFFDDVKTQIKCDRFRDKSIKEFKLFFKELDKKGFKVDKPGAFNTLIAAKVDENGNTKKLPVFNAVIGDERFTPDIISQLDDAQAKENQVVFKKDFIAEQNFVQNDFVRHETYLVNEKINDFKYKYAMEFGIPLHKIDKMDLRDIVGRHKGGFFEKTFGTTSKEFKAVMTNVENFYDNTSKDYHDTDFLAQSSQRYLKYKGVKTYEDIQRLKGTAKARALFCFSIVSTCAIKPRNLNFAKDYVQVPSKPIDYENDALNGQPAIVEIVDKELAIPNKKIIEENLVGPADIGQNEPDNAMIKSDNSNDGPDDDYGLDELFSE